MPEKYPCVIPKPDRSNLTITFTTGKSTIFVGANGSGKTRLGVHIENHITPKFVHRIAAHKSLRMNDQLPVISVERADNMFRFGHEAGEQYKMQQRWGLKPATHLLSDFDGLLQTLFSKHNRVASKFFIHRRTNPPLPDSLTELESLKNIWDSLLPHRTLEILEASVQVHNNPETIGPPYPGSEMSDGERAIFYLLGQSLLAPRGGVIIVDEPEAHIHKAILSPLWTAIETARPDCAFVYITHDLDFAAQRELASKYYLRSYRNTPLSWDIEELPKDTGLPEQMIMELVGSRKPILFVEGDRGSYDFSIYQGIYPNFTIVPVGGCEAIIRSVGTFRNRPTLHWLTVRGLIDSDGRNASERAHLASQDVFVLPVAEVENLFLLPDVFTALAKALLCPDPESLLEKLTNEVVGEASTNVNQVAARHTSRQLDARLKKVELEARDLPTLETEFRTQLGQIDITPIFNEFKGRLDSQIATKNLAGILELYDNKGLLSRVTRVLGLQNQKTLIEKLVVLLNDKNVTSVKEELNRVLPVIAS
jgi:ABC-type dipeptide/oligopeptide/nickel transport system ATPase component